MGAPRWWIHGCPRCDDIRLCYASSSDINIIAGRLNMQPRSVVRHLLRHEQHDLLRAMSNVPKWTVTT